MVVFCCCYSDTILNEAAGANNLSFVRYLFRSSWPNDVTYSGMA
jgi:hypothetical protein